MAGNEQLTEIELLRDWLATRMGQLADFQGVRILSRKTANIANEIERSLAKERACIVVLIPEATVETVQSKTVFVNPEIIIRCITGLGNKTGKSALYLAARAIAQFHLERPPYTFCHGVLRTAAPGLRELNILPRNPDADESEDYAGWDVFLTTKLSLEPRA